MKNYITSKQRIKEIVGYVIDELEWYVVDEAENQIETYYLKLLDVLMSKELVIVNYEISLALIEKLEKRLRKLEKNKHLRKIVNANNVKNDLLKLINE